MTELMEALERVRKLAGIKRIGVKICVHCCPAERIPAVTRTIARELEIDSDAQFFSGEYCEWLKAETPFIFEGVNREVVVFFPDTERHPQETPKAEEAVR